MKASRLSIFFCLNLFWVLVSTNRTNAESTLPACILSAQQTSDTVLIFLFQQVCAGDSWNGLAWQKDTVVSFFKAGINNDDTLQIVEIDVVPLPDFDIAGDSLLCTGDTGLLKVAGFFNVYQWSNGSNTSMIEVNTPGIYRATVTANTGCTGTKEVSVSVFMPDFILDFQPPTCAGDTDGAISIKGFFGGLAPYMVSINGGVSQADSVFDNLPAGDYTLVLQDAAGCADSMTLSLTAPPQFTVEMGPDIFLAPGDSLRLSTHTSDSVAFWQWSPAQMLDCTDCPEPFVRRPATSVISVTVTNATGCTASDALFLTYDSEERLFVPNIFSPNDDGENDFFEVFPGKGNWEVAEFVIADRWGGLVFQADSPFRFPQTLEWDGKNRHKQLLPGVYTWAARLRLADGSEAIREGDVTIIR